MELEVRFARSGDDYWGWVDGQEVSLCYRALHWLFGDLSRVIWVTVADRDLGPDSVLLERDWVEWVWRHESDRRYGDPDNFAGQVDDVLDRVFAHKGKKRLWATVWTQS